MSDFQVALTNTAGVSSVMSFWVFVASNASKRFKDVAVKLAEIVLIVGFVALTIAIITRGIEAQRFPLANLYESLLWFAWATMGGFIYVSRAYGIHQLGWLASLTAATFFIYGSWLPASQHEIAPLVPALVSYWRQIHVPPLIVSYAMFFLAGLSGLLQLYKAGRYVSLGLSVATIAAACTAIGLGTYTETDTHWLQLLFVGSSLVGTVFSWRFLGKVNPAAEASADCKKAAEMYDDVGFRCVSIGFPLLTIGIITGGLWANHAWGSYWSWDPKESMALVTWLSYAAYIHLRVQRDLSAEKLSVVSVLGLLLTLLTYLGFNSLGFGGLHSYGKFKP
ncbi:MAG: c-type cytochrome biogenesis protein CcsB [Cyanobacteria bacterium SZAS LIN-2]|nr:c-type cytochrome biogenesis protein CcsB [Cyanobacteria bacterium SZAS LIN-3]MBS1995739.1 c-type cytochrome biogenesis protein CcsB [Cyanobacteria bacterium SZAS LIN-2]MBS2005803.1 c-type cytochrome biogenesis protein CcsB [Cyanobacteria bacterium SZAS TMP-1]